MLRDVLGQNFEGILEADFWGAYRKYARQCGVLIQFCLAHLVREVKYLCEFQRSACPISVVGFLLIHIEPRRLLSRTAPVNL